MGGLAAVTTGFVLGQDKINNKLSGRALWALVVFLFGTGALITSLVNGNHYGYTYQWGNLAMEIGGAVLACAMAKTVFHGASVSPHAKAWLFLLFLGIGCGGGYMASQLMTYPGWAALSSFFLCASGAVCASLAEDLITKNIDAAPDSEGGSDTRSNRAHNRSSTGSSGAVHQRPGVPDFTLSHDDHSAR